MSEKKFEKTEKKESPAKTEPASVAFSVESKINNYGFIFMRKKWLAALGWKKGMPADEWITWRKESKVETVLPAEFEFPFRTAKKKTRKKQAGSTPIPPILLTYSG